MQTKSIQTKFDLDDSFISLNTSNILHYILGIQGREAQKQVFSLRYSFCKSDFLLHMYKINPFEKKNCQSLKLNALNHVFEHHKETTVPGATIAW